MNNKQKGASYEKITRKITLGMYVLTTPGGGCIVDAASQINTGDKPLISVSVMKNNYTNELLKVTIEKGKTAWIYSIRGYVYCGDELPEDYQCPTCGVGREFFDKK